MFATERTAPNGSALTDALAVLEGQAQQADPVDLALRTARHENVLLLDLGTSLGAWSQSQRMAGRSSTARPCCSGGQS